MSYFLVKNCPGFLVVSKSENISTTGSSSETSLYSLVLSDLLKKEKSSRLFPVHRLDKTTSGLVLFAKDFRYKQALEDLFKKRKVNKEYQALVDIGIVDYIQNLGQQKFIKKKSALELEITLPIAGEKTKSHIDMIEGRSSYTKIKVIKAGHQFALLDIELKSGRFHQIRVHLQAIGFPIIGDQIYGGIKSKRIFLHSHKIHFKDPFTSTRWSFYSPSGFEKDF